MERLAKAMEEKINQQDEEFLNKMGIKKWLVFFQIWFYIQK